MAPRFDTEARRHLIEELKGRPFPFDISEGPVIGRILDWTEEVLSRPEGEISGDPESEYQQAVSLLEATSEAMLSGTSRQEFIDLLGTEDWQSQPAEDVLAAQRLVMGDRLLDATMADLTRVSEKLDVEAERALLSEEEIAVRNEVRDQAAGEQVRENLKKGKAPFPDNKGGITEIPTPPDLSVTTQTLRAFQERATERGLSRVLSADRAARLDPNAYHEVLNAWDHRSGAGFRNIRVAIRLHFGMAYERQAQTEQVILDFLTQDWDMLMVPYKNAQREYGINKHVPGLYLSTPKWEAVRSYPTVHEIHSFYQGHLAAYEQTGFMPRSLELPRINMVSLIRGERQQDSIILGAEAIRDWMARPRTILGAETLEALHEAHPVVFDPEWVDVQEDWGWAEAWAYAARVVLPYDPLYLDFEGPGGTLPFIDIPGGQRVPLSGCLFATDSDTGRLTITPMGPRVLLDNIYWPDIPMGGTPYEMAGRVIIGGPWETDQATHLLHDENDSDAFLVEYEGPRGLTDAMAVINLPSANGLHEQYRGELPPGIDVNAIPGYIELPLNEKEALHSAFANDEEDRDSQGRSISAAARWTAATVPAAVKSLSMLSLLDNENVELRPYPVSRQVRRNAQRKGIPIASEIVVVRKHRYVDGKRVQEGDGRHINYSHQFPVRRHEQHHGPHTPAYRAHPEKAKPCGRCGSCRRFVVESYIKGDPDKPLVARKTYVFRDGKT